MSAMAALRSTPLDHLLRLAASAGVRSAVRLRINRGDDLNARDDVGLPLLMLNAAPAWLERWPADYRTLVRAAGKWA